MKKKFNHIFMTDDSIFYDGSHGENKINVDADSGQEIVCRGSTGSATAYQGEEDETG